MGDFVNLEESIKASYDLRNTNCLKVSLSAAPVIIVGVNSDSAPVKKWSINTEDGQEIFHCNEVKSGSDTLKALFLADEIGTNLLQISYRLGAPATNIFLPNGSPLGEVSQSMGFWCCFGFSIKCTFTDATRAEEKIIMKGFLSPFCVPCIMMRGSMDFDVYGRNGELVGKINAFSGNTRLEIRFSSATLAEQDRKIILSMCIGMIDQSYEKGLRPAYGRSSDD